MRNRNYFFGPVELELRTQYIEPVDYDPVAVEIRRICISFGKHDLEFIWTRNYPTDVSPEG